METRSFFQRFRGFLTLIVAGTLGMTFQLVYTMVAWRDSLGSFALMALALYFLISFFRGLQERDFPDWNRVELTGDKVTGYNLFGKKLATVDLAPNRMVYWAKVWVPKERGTAEPILVVSNQPFTLPKNPDQLFRTVFDKTKQLLIVGAPDHPSQWFPNAELIPVETVDGQNRML